MSYDYVFAIAQTLKGLSVSKKGAVSTNPSGIDGSNSFRPDLLILMHISYFFNISRTNKVVSSDSAFNLYLQGGEHQISTLDRYVAPFH